MDSLERHRGTRLIETNVSQMDDNESTIDPSTVFVSVRNPGAKPCHNNSAVSELVMQAGRWTPAGHCYSNLFYHLAFPSCSNLATRTDLCGVSIAGAPTQYAACSVPVHASRHWYNLPPS